MFASSRVGALPNMKMETRLLLASNERQKENLVVEDAEKFFDICQANEGSASNRATSARRYSELLHFCIGAAGVIGYTRSHCCRTGVAGPAILAIPDGLLPRG
jgi:hypothetical protein